MTRFVGIPSVPLGQDQNLVRILLALKENVELLTDQRGEADKASAALTVDLSGVPLAEAQFRSMSARGAGVIISNNPVPTLTDYVRLMQDVELLATDVINLRTIVNLLITELKER